MGEGSRALSYAVRLPVLGKYLGQLGVMLALLTLAPLLASLYFADYALSLRYLQVELALLAVSLLLARLPSPAQLQQNEALVIVALAFLLSPLLMSYPMSGAGLTLPQALFEAVSAVTTTGLTILPSVEGASPAFLFARVWMQWYGGLGIVVLSVALLLGHHIASRRLAEPLSGEGLATTTRTYARRMLVVYLGLTGIALLALLASGMGGFDALLHTLAAISTGGFSHHDRSLAALSASQGMVVIMVGLCGAIPLHLYYRVRQQGLAQLGRDSEFRTLLLLALLGAALLSLLLRQEGMAWNEALFHGTIQALSALSTSGFASLDIATLDDTGKLGLIVLMFIGGGVGSTAGGIKVLRLLILLRLLQLLLRRTALANHAVSNTQLAGHDLEGGEIQNALLLILLFLLLVMLSWLIFVGYGYPPLDALFEVVSASATVGLSSGISGPALEGELQALLMLNMLLGRLEIIALLVVLYPPTWLGRRTEV
ncbi:MAG: TrkH family potassium uptake protein [Gammaproteobacteria bacterium]|nr:TrkH family potassium uptake protein [Gammaproteobacteria bacterium]